jgi:hypothetical protein
MNFVRTLSVILALCAALLLGVLAGRDITGLAGNIAILAATIWGMFCLLGLLASSLAD